MIPDERIKELCAQLLRSQNPIVVEAVAYELRAAIDAYVSKVTQLRSEALPVTFTPVPAEP